MPYAQERIARIVLSVIRRHAITLKMGDFTVTLTRRRRWVAMIPKTELANILGSYLGQ